MRSRRFVVPAAGVFALGCLVPLGSASAATTSLACGQRITQDTTLTVDLTCDGVAVTLAGYVGLNLNGHTITGDVDNTVNAHRSSYRVLDGTVNGNLVDVGVSSGGGTDELILRRMTLHGDIIHAGQASVTTSTITGGIRYAHPNTLDVVVFHSTIFGLIDAYGVVRVTGSTTGFINEFNREVFVRGSTVAGIHAADTAVTVTDSTVGGGGISTDRTFGDVLDHDTISGAAIGYQGGGVGTKGPSITNTRFVHNGIGVALYGEAGVPKTKISGSSFVANTGAGLVVEPVSPGSFATGSTISHNVFRGNGGDGLRVASSTLSPGFTVTSNTADHNNGYGINAPGVVDGGGNIATGNTNPVQCVGVVCLP